MKFGGGASGGFYTEIGRTTLSGTASTINVSYTDKPYVMILISWARETSPSADPKGQLGDSSADTDSDYARRLSEGGGSDSTNTGVDYFTQWATGSGSTVRNFQVIPFINNASSEKIIQERGCFAGATGSGSAPYRTENVASWTETSAQAGYFSYVGGGTTFSSGSEVVVLGYDPADNTGTSAWELLGSDTLTSDGTTLEVSFTAKKYLMVQMSYSGATNGVTDAILRVGAGSIDAGTNYCDRRSVNGGSDTTQTGGSSWYNSFCWAGFNGVDTWHTTDIMICNPDGQEKNGIGFCNRSNTVSAGTASWRVEAVGKYTESGQINKIQLTGSGGSATQNYASGSTLSVWGFD